MRLSPGPIAASSAATGLCLLVVTACGCEGRIIEVSGSDARVTPDSRGSEGGAPDTGVDLTVGMDLTATSGEPCTYGQCGPGLICMANICQTMCNGRCGEIVPECPEDYGCYWASDFTGACFPGTADLREDCGDGVFCKAGMVCVKNQAGVRRCYKLCQYGCAPGEACVDLTNGCEVCYSP